MTPNDRVARLLSQFGTSGTCLARVLCDDHPRDQVAFTFVQSDLSTFDLTYGSLREQSERFAGALAALGVRPGDCVGVLMGKSEELAVALLAIWRLGAVHVPLFTAFAPAAIAMRLTSSVAKVVVVDADQRPKLDPSEDVPTKPAWKVVTVGDQRGSDLSFKDLVAGGTPAPPVTIEPDDPFIMIYTSGTTGAPKGVPTPVRAIAHMVSYLEFGLDVQPADVYWNAADPGWAYGLFYAIVAPLAMGRRSVLVRGSFSAERTWDILAQMSVSNFAAAPTVYRALRSVCGFEGVSLRCASSAGEPLTPELIPWAEGALGAPIRDHYGQTEIGMVVGNSWNHEIRRDIKPSSMGYPFPGFGVGILSPDSDEVAPTATLGRVALETSAPLFSFVGYHDAPEATSARFCGHGRWYLTGDVASMDADGALFFSGRDDDVIIMAGYRISPFDVESVLVSHPDVADAAVIGVPDVLRGEVLEAFVVLVGDVAAQQQLTEELQQLVKTKFAAHAFPRTIHYARALPRTPSGKIQRFVLRAERAAMR
jgi:acetyl-CoA synthetase